AVLGDAGHGQERLEVGLDAHGPRARAAPAVRRREGLVEVEVADVEAEVARPRDAEDRVEVGAVHVDLHALGVTQLGDLDDPRLEHAYRVRHGDYERGHVHIEVTRQLYQVYLEGA